MGSAMNARLVKNVPSNQMALIEMAVACLAVFLYIVLNDNESFQFNQLNSSNVALLMVLGIVATSFPFIASIAVMRQISPFVCAMAINMEPVYSILLALWLYGQSEFMSFGFYLGGGLIILTTFASSLMGKRS